MKFTFFMDGDVSDLKAVIKVKESAGVPNIYIEIAPQNVPAGI